MKNKPLAFYSKKLKPKIKENKMSRVFTIDGTIETPSNYDEDDLSDIIIELMKEQGFLFTGDISFLEEIPDIDDDEEEQKEEE